MDLHPYNTVCHNTTRHDNEFMYIQFKFNLITTFTFIIYLFNENFKF
jgi:hypothetical protein